jgi:hypothetical protein
VNLQELADVLTNGPDQALSSLRMQLGSPAGVFTVWYRDELLYLGRSNRAADECSPGNADQADGVWGRLRGVTRQPPIGVQRALAPFFPEDFSHEAGSDRARASALLKLRGRCRAAEVGAGREAEDAHQGVLQLLTARGLRTLADRVP